jgi:hypothetical protein
VSEQKAMGRLSLPLSPPEAPVAVAAQRGSVAELVVCPVCFLPVPPGPPSAGGGCASHKGLLHAECVSSLPTRGCPFCRPEVRALGKAGMLAIVQAPSRYYLPDRLPRTLE